MFCFKIIKLIASVPWRGWWRPMLGIFEKGAPDLSKSSMPTLRHIRKTRFRCPVYCKLYRTFVVLRKFSIIHKKKIYWLFSNVKWERSIFWNFFFSYSSGSRTSQIFNGRLSYMFRGDLSNNLRQPHTKNWLGSWPARTIIFCLYCSDTVNIRKNTNDLPLFH